MREDGEGRAGERLCRRGERGAARLLRRRGPGARPPSLGRWLGAGDGGAGGADGGGHRGGGQAAARRAEDRLFRHGLWVSAVLRAAVGGQQPARGVRPQPSALATWCERGRRLAALRHAGPLAGQGVRAAAVRQGTLRPHLTAGLCDRVRGARRLWRDSASSPPSGACTPRRRIDQ